MTTEVTKKRASSFTHAQIAELVSRHARDGQAAITETRERAKLIELGLIEKPAPADALGDELRDDLRGGVDNVIKQNGRSDAAIRFVIKHLQSQLPKRAPKATA